MKILQISTASNEKEGDNIYGLGEDMRMYVWNWREGKWQIYKYER